MININEYINMNIGYNIWFRNIINKIQKLKSLYTDISTNNIKKNQ